VDRSDRPAVTGIAAPESVGGALALALAAAGLVLFPDPGRRPVVARVRRRIQPRTRRMAFGGAGLAGAGLLMGLPWWLAIGAGAAGMFSVRRLPVRSPPPDAAELRRAALLLDLLAICMEAGMPVSQAISAVLQAGGGAASDEPAGGAAGYSGGARAVTATVADAPGVSARPGVRDVLAEVAALLALGADPQSAWRAAARHPLLEPLAGAAVRSALGGVRMAGAVRQLSAELRARCRTLSERSAARAGVAMTAPLALCFLPAFVCLGLAPVVIGLISSLHIW
jgi:hypothetical protein